MRKSNLKSFPLVTGGNMSANITSPVTNIEFLDNISLQFNFTGTPIGTFQVQISNDYLQDNFGNVQNAGNWIPLNLAPAPAASGAAGNIVVELPQIGSSWIRAVYTASSGTGTLGMYIAGKMI